MTREQAAREARRRWGKRASYRAHEKQSSPERRETASREMKAARERRDAIDKEIDERMKALDWYQMLSAERRELVQRLKYSGEACYYKFAVGEDIGIGFHIYGQGDTWEEAFTAADEHSRRERERYAAAAAAAR